MQYPIYQEVFELYTWEVGDKFYQFGIVYDLVEVENGSLLKITDILIEEVV